MTYPPRNPWRTTLMLIVAADLWFLATLGAMHFFQRRNASRALPHLETTIQRLKDNLPEHSADPAYIAQLRDLDLLYRQAYFTTSVQNARAENLLAGALLLLLAASAGVMAMDRYRPSRPPAGTATAIYTFQDRVSLVVPWLAAGTALAVTLFLLSGQRLEPRPQPAETAGGTPAIPADPLYSTPHEQALQWPQFRPERVPDYPFDPEASLQIAWKTRLPLPGFSSPVIWNDRIFLSGGDHKTMAILAYSSHDGQELWRLPAPPTAQPPPDVSNDTGYAAATPVTDGYRVAAIFATGQLVCADHDGRQLWYRQMPQPQILYGYANSLLLHGSRLIVQIDTETQHTLLALDIASGETLWENNRPEHTASSWSSPIIARKADGTLLIITLSNDLMEAFQLEDGRSLWKQECMSGEIASSPVFRAGRILLAHSGLAARAFSPEDGTLEWSIDTVLLPDVASPAADSRCLYLAESSGTVSAVNLETGALLWEKEHSHGFYASPTIFSNGTLLLADLTGKLLLWQTGDDAPPTPRQQLELGEPVFATPAISSDALVVRSEKHVLKLVPAR